MRKENAGRGRQKIDEERALENDFQRNIGKVRDEFIAFCKSDFNVNINKEKTKAIFDKYTYSVSRNSNFDMNKELQNSDAFMFCQFMRHLVDIDEENLDVIESFGVANQIRSLVINDDMLNDKDEHFLGDCEIFIHKYESDTPPLAAE